MFFLNCTMSRDITQMQHKVIKNPSLHVVLYQPEIPANTGNIARLCAATQIPLHLIRPLGFRTDDKHLKRAGLDYWKEVDVRIHDSLGYLLDMAGPQAEIHCFSRHASKIYTQAIVRKGIYLLFGPETRGLPLDIMSQFQCYKIPMWGSVRSLNLSTAVGIVAYHYLYKLGKF